MSLAPLNERQMLEAGLLHDRMADPRHRAAIAGELAHLRAFAEKCRHDRRALPQRLRAALDDHVAPPADYALDSAAAELRGEAPPELELEP